ncbi:MAG: hypothetical protein FWF29_09120, partial [Treponema sp.]|nr:hypothetical protein [Treponema sp.]
MKNDFDHVDWITKFDIASQKKIGYRELRKKIFLDTIQFVQNGGYYTDGVFVHIPGELPDSMSEFFDAPEKL